MLRPQVSILSLFRQVHHDRTAVKDEHGNGLTYAELDNKSSQLARYLLSLGTLPGQLVPLLTSSCIDMVVGVLGILKAGATYVPIDRAQWTQERINYVIRRCNPGIVVYTGDEMTIDDCQTIHLPLLGRHGEDVKENDEYHFEADVMCVIFTSGTTGTPKGVQIRSSAVAKFVSSPGFNYDICPGDHVLLVLSVAFDACMGTLFNTICNGGVVVLANGLNFQQMARICNILVLTPSILEALRTPESPTDYQSVNKIVLGGETAPKSLLDAWSILNIPFWVAYGPTEATCAVLTECLTRSESTGEYHPSRFSRCIPGGQITLRGEGMVAVEELGRDEEICISGECLAAGYLMDEKLTQERFLLHQGTPVYRTGDLGRWVLSEQGTKVLELCGRRDRLVKIRGFLVNLDLDVDATLLQMDANIKATFSLIIDGKLCTAFVPGVECTDEKSLLAKWRLAAPLYMVPDHLIAMDHLPLSPSAKIDPNGVAKLLRMKIHQAPLPQTLYSGIEDVILDGISAVLGVSASQISLTESLVAQGMHSLAATKLSSFCHRHGYDVPVYDIMTQSSVELLMTACRDRKLQSPSIVPGHKRGQLKSDAVIPFQKKMILASMQDPRIYRVKHIAHYTTDQIPHLRKAWSVVISNEAAFQLDFQATGADLIHCVDEGRTVIWDEREVSCPEDITREISQLDHDTGFRSIFRVLTFQGRHLPQNESMLVWSTHHALMDAFSASLVFDKVDAALQERPMPASPPYSEVVQDLVRWQASIAHEAEQFWKQQEELYPEASGELSIIKPEGKVNTGYATYITPGRLDMDTITSAARTMKVSPSAIFFTAWAMVLATYCQTDTVAFGAVLSGRGLPFPRAQTFVGALINTLPLRMKIMRSDEPTESVQKMHSTLQALSAISVANSPRNGPRFSTAVVVQESGLKSGPMGIAPLQDPYVEECADLPLIAVVEPHATIKLHYNQEEISASHIENMASIFFNSIQLLTDAGLVTMKDIFQRQLRSTTRERLLAMGNFTSPMARIDMPRDTVVDRFYAAAALAPKNVAVEKAGRIMTYMALASSVKQVAHTVETLVLAGATVAVLADRSINWIVGIFGALAANTIYCPLDPSYSAEYQAELLRRSTAKLLLVPNISDWRGPSNENVVILGIDQILAGNVDLAAWCQRLPGPHDKAYLCFTSGSTGKPKGVLCEHRGLAALHSSPATRMHSEPGRRVAQFMAPGFDGSVHEILATLSFGGTLVLRTRDNDPFSHLTDVDVALLNPSVVAHMSPVDYPNLQHLYLGGEPVPQPIVDQWAPGRALYNIYGPTETTVAVCLQRLHEKVPVNIGPPFPTVRIYILNDHLELQPPGTPGNIYIAGVQVGPGYLDMPDVTESEYRQDPFATWSEEERMYRTGDVGFWDEFGNVHCCGRKDRQVKLGGYRINLETIAEVALQQMPQIRACVATVERQRIVLWLEPEDVSVSKLHQRLRTYLPPYAVPKMIRPIKSIPVNTYGKLDIKSLACWQEEETMELALPGPDRGLQQALANEWRLLLKLSPSVELTGLDSFMLHGGDSLLQLALAARIQKIFDIIVAPKDIIEAKSLDDMVTLIECRCDRNGSKVGELQTSSLGLQRLSSAEIWWLYRYRNSMCQSGFNVPYVANLSASIDRERLASALKTVLNRHRILRSRFLVNGEAAHRVISDTEIDVPMVSSVDIPAFINHPFNLSEDSLVRAVITPACLVLNISHIVCDLTSLKAIFRETGELYYGRVLPPVSREYFDTTMWSRPIDVDTAQFWTEELGDLDLNILREREKLLARSYRGTSLVTTIPTNIYQNLIMSTKKSGVTLHQTGLAVTALVLHVLSNKENIVMAAPFINRFSSEDQGVVGLFLEPLPVRVRLKDLHRSISSLLNTVRETSQAALANAIPWSTLVEHLGLSAQTDSPQIFNCAVTFHDDRVFTESLPIDGVSAQNVWTEGSKFGMLFEWHAMRDQLSLRIEYDTDCFTGEFARLMSNLLTRALGLALAPETSLQEAIEELEAHLNHQCQALGLDVSDITNKARKFLTGPWV
ncbi:unnamed protein product [Penicillium viridicatum]